MNNKIKSLAAVFAAMAMSDSFPQNYNRVERKLIQPKDENTSEKQKPIPKGCKEFVINGEKIIALNRKNAERKYINYVQDKN